MKLGTPHVVILGAGASRAAFPNGDKNGIKLPLMNDFAETVGLEDILKTNNIFYKGQNFEDLYDDLSLNYEGAPFLEDIDVRIHNYFSQLRLPDDLTIYDKLVLSLRGKDLIATFNWDPLLAQAYQRNSYIAKLPRMVFLHGNVAIGVCLKDKVKGYVGARCLLCGEWFKHTKLLYPIKQKDYTRDPFIKNEWDELDIYLKDAYFLTIYGYSAPKIDIEAINLMKKVWLKNERRDIAEIGIIDIKSKDELHRNWDDFIVRSHYFAVNDFKHCYLSLYPRRSCEGLFMATMQNQPWNDNYLPDCNTLEEFHDWIKPLVLEENTIKDEQEGFCGLQCSELRKKYY